MDAELVKQLIDTGSALGHPQEINGLRYALVPEGFKYQALNTESSQPYPNRVRAQTILCETASFVQYMAAFRNSGTRIWCNREQASFGGVLDYHLSESTQAEAPPSPAARWGEHRAMLQLRKTPEWKAWTEHNKKQFTQLGFAEFLEDQTPFIVKPSGAELLEIALNLEETGKAAFQSTQRLQDGARTFKFQDDKSTTVKVPEMFDLTLAPFEGTTPTLVRARLRYRVNSGALVFFYVLVNPEVTERLALDKAVSEIEEGTGIKVLFGSLETMGAARV